MTLARGSIGGYEYDRMVLKFSMLDGAREIPCAVSSVGDGRSGTRRADGADPAGGAVRPATRPDRTMRGAQIPGAGVRGHASRPHSAQHRFSQLSASAHNGRRGEPSVMFALIGRRGANISVVGGTLHRQRRCQPIPKRSGIGDPPQSAVSHDQIHLGPGDIRASGSGGDCVAGLRACREGERSRGASQGRPAGYSFCCWRMCQPELAESRAILSARCRVGCRGSRGPSRHGAPLNRT